MQKKKTAGGKRTSFILYHSQREVLKYLTVEEKASLLQAIFDYEVTGEYEEPAGGAAVAFALIREQLARDGQLYEAKCEENRRSAQKRWEKRKTEQAEASTKKADAIACERILNDTYTKADTDTEAVTDTDTYTDTEVSAASGASFSGALSRDTRQPPVPAAQEDIDARAERLFGAFWNAYPRRMHLERARQAWDALIGADTERASAVMRALARAVREDYRFLDGHIPYPSNWLRNESPWESDWAPPPNALAEGRSPPGGLGGTPSFDTDEFFARALEKSYGRGP